MKKTEIATSIRLLKLNLIDLDRRMKLGSITKESYKIMKADAMNRIVELKKEKYDDR